MNAVSFVAYCGQLAGLPAVDAMQRAHEVLYYVGLGEARYRNVETYSTGMKQRIKLAQALVHDPDLLFLDEPTNGMDPKGRDEMLELVRDLGHNKGVSLILSSHLLPDVEFTCDYVVVMDKGQVATQGPIDELKGPDRPRLRAAHQGRPARLPRRAREGRHGIACDRRGRDARVRARGGRAITRRSSRRPRSSASRCGTCARACRRSRTCSRRRSAKNEMPIHDQSYRHYGGGKAAPGRSWTVIAWAGITTFIKKRAFLGLLLFALAPFIVRAVQMWISANYPQAAILAPTAETFRQFLEQQDFFVFVITVYVGAGLIANDRRANALQIYLSKPLMRSEYIVGKLAVLFAFLLLVTLRAGDAAAAAEGDVRRQLHVPEEQPVPGAGDHHRQPAAGHAGVVHDAGAVVAVEERALRRHPLRRHHLLHRPRSTARSTPSPAAAACRGSRSAPTSRRSSTSSSG